MAMKIDKVGALKCSGVCLGMSGILYFGYLKGQTMPGGASEPHVLSDTERSFYLILSILFLLSSLVSLVISIVLWLSPKK